MHALGVYLPQMPEAFEAKKLTDQKKLFYGRLIKLLNDLSTASRANSDILAFWGLKSPEIDFDVFLCHNGDDKDEIRAIAKALREHGIRPWFDEEQIAPGRPWQDALVTNIPKIKSVAVFVGKSGYGPWQLLEIKAFLQEFVKRQCPVIPVILGEGAISPELTLFLQQFMWVDYRKTQPNPLNQLVWGITGRKT